jgi:TRAP-type C4-dicarboxylate transport system substrate-binding protein
MLYREPAKHRRVAFFASHMRLNKEGTMRRRMIAQVSCGLVMAFALTLGLGGNGYAQSKTVELKLATFVPNTGVEYRGVLDVWAKQVEKATDGRVKVRIYPSESLAKQKDIYDNVVTGFADLGNFNQWASPGRFPLSDVIEMPLSPWSNDVRQANFVLQKLYDEGYIKDDYKDVKMINLHNITPYFIHSTKKPVRKLEDFKGIKIAAPGTVAQMVTTAMGATPINVPAPELYLALQRGVVDCTFWSWTGLNTFNLHELTKYHTMVGINISAFAIVMNKDKWNSLSPTDQKAIDGVSGLSLARVAGKAWYEEDLASIEKARKMPGVEIIQLPESELQRWRDQVQPIRDKWVQTLESKGMPAKKIVDAAYRIAKEYKE